LRKSCACTTCHVLVREGFNSLNEASETEEPAGQGLGLEAVSRLSCQAVVADEDLVIIEIPKYTINHASEGGH
jgi:2Fe-2S ferredoxin